MQKITIDHNEIRRWAEARGGIPEVIDHERARGGRRGIRINFPGDEDERYLAGGHEGLSKDVSWGEFFDVFEDQRLAFSYDDEEFESDPSLSYRFVKRE